MKILMIGLGSIGQRHLRNIKKLCGNQDEILAFRVRGLQRTFSEDMQVREGVSLEEEYHIRVFHNLELALREKPDVAFITNITSLHMESALRTVEAGCDIFMEKPLSDCMEGVRELEQAVRQKGTIFYMGYQNRFHPCIVDTKRLLADIGPLVSVSHTFGERLPTMHSYEDYKDTYMARKSMGGGVVLNLQIHALDYLQHMVGKPLSVFTVAGNSGGLEIDVEDHASSIYSVQSEDGRVVPIYTHTDFWQFPPVHTFRFIGMDGRIEVDLNKAETVVYIDGALAHTIQHQEFTRNDLFLAELQDFFHCVQEREYPKLDIGQGIVSLKMALMAKRSAQTNTIVKWEDI